MTKRPRHVLWSLVAPGLWALTVAAAQGKSVSLAGTWKYSDEKTMAERKGEPGDPRVREGYSSGGRPRVGTGITDVGGGTSGRRPGGATEGGAGGGNLGPLSLYARPLPQLLIAQSDSTITISDASGTPRTYRTNGKKQFEPLIGADTLEITAKWKDGKLTTERKLGSFGAIRETYSIDSEAHTLIVEVRLTAPQLSQPMDMRRVYDAAPGS